jgi:hypothetical protein
MVCEAGCATVFLVATKALTTGLGLISCIIIYYLIWKHVVHFTNPYFQKKIIGNFPLKILLVILNLIPFYCLSAIIGSLFLISHRGNEILHALRAIYEAMLILSFFHLIVAYVCYTEKVRQF